MSDVWIVGIVGAVGWALWIRLGVCGMLNRRAMLRDEQDRNFANAWRLTH